MTRVVFSPDGRHLLTISFDEMAAPDEVVATDRLATPEYVATGRLWSLEEGKERFTFAAYGHRPETIVFGSDGKSALTIDDETARLWDLTERASADADRSPAVAAAAHRSCQGHCVALPHDRSARAISASPKPPRWCIALASPYGTKVWRTNDSAR